MLIRQAEINTLRRRGVLERTAAVRPSALDLLATWAPAALVAAASAVAVLHGIGFAAWFDEAFSYGLATQPLHDFLRQWIWGPESNMALYYVVLRLWLGVTGLIGMAPSEVLLRIPNVLPAIGASVMVYLIGKRIFGQVAGLVAAGLYLMNFLQIIVAQLARSYALELFLLAFSWYALFSALEGRPTARRWWVAYVIGSTLSVYAALFSGLVLLSQAAALLAMLLIPGPWQGRLRSSLRPAIVSLAVTFILIVPIGIDAVVHGGPVWVPPVRLHDIRVFFSFLGGDSRRYELAVFGAAAFGGLMALVGALSKRARLHLLRSDAESLLAPAVAIACWFVIPIAISFALTQPHLNLHLFFTRYLVVVIPPLCLLAGLGAAILRWRVVQAALGVGLLLVAFPQLLHYYPYQQVQNFRDPVSWIEQRYQPGDGLVCAPIVECGIPVEYYLELDREPARFDANSPGRFFWHGGLAVPIDPQTVANYAASHRRIFFIYGPLGYNPTHVAEAQRLETMLGAPPHAALAQITAHSASDTSVVLFQVQP